MLNLADIREKIKELESQETSMQNCSKLSVLYTVLEHNANHADTVTKELNDILPEYTNFVHTKRQYQTGLLPKEAVVSEMKKLCKELDEFIVSLYQCSDMPEERACLIDTLSKDIQKIKGQN